jgi:hypothetical protein
MCIVQVVSDFVYEEAIVANIVGSINQEKQKFYSGNILYAV